MYTLQNSKRSCVIRVCYNIQHVTNYNFYLYILSNGLLSKLDSLSAKILTTTSLCSIFHYSLYSVRSSTIFPEQKWRFIPSNNKQYAHVLR